MCPRRRRSVGRPPRPEPLPNYHGNAPALAEFERAILEDLAANLRLMEWLHNLLRDYVAQREASDAKPLGPCHT
jgi:hypothetical protein